MKALLIIDMQRDFMPNGALAVPKADRLIPIINEIMIQFDCVIATQDWHPKNHASFISMGGKWPAHCIQNTEGAAFAKGLKTEKFTCTIHKGTDPKVESYSAFFDEKKTHSTGLEETLKKKKIDELYFVGVATDYCVLYSVLDALELGFNAFVIQDGCRAIQDEKGAFEKMRRKGAHLILSRQFFS
ncbi:MAG: hypothetical protein A3E80_02765 [Chlamydiae bacterium RIFCSPHIGHO2_12_FULL_49_9]|nr:MAG: hypothetical protein A3E80_02765 [Chlamydiae bacterium RIFCSPHIGHO2_12_FULL_49_9]